MSVTQFIGPRQAPLWADPVEWNSTRTYEPYTFVTYQGDSYSSRQTVPLGVQITNGKYWVKVSDFNAQAAAMQTNLTAQLEANETDVQNMITTAKQDVATSVNHVDSVANEFKANIEQLNNLTKISDYLRNKKAVCYGDSTMALTPSYMTIVSDITGLNITNRAISGTKITGPLSVDKSHPTLYERVRSATEETFADFDYCFLAYSTNDWQSSAYPYSIGDVFDSSIEYGRNVYSFYSSLEYCINRIQKLNPTIQIVFIAPAFAYRSDFVNNINSAGFSLQDYITIVKQICTKYGVALIDLSLLNVNKNNVSSWFLRETNYTQDIYVHYNTALKYKIAQFIVNSFPWSVPAPINKGNILFVANYINVSKSHTPSVNWLNTQSAYNNYRPPFVQNQASTLYLISNEKLTLKNIMLNNSTYIHFYFVARTANANDVIIRIIKDDTTMMTFYPYINQGFGLYGLNASMPPNVYDIELERINSTQSDDITGFCNFCISDSPLTFYENRDIQSIESVNNETVKGNIYYYADHAVISLRTVTALSAYNTSIYTFDETSPFTKMRYTCESAFTFIKSVITPIHITFSNTNIVVNIPSTVSLEDTSDIAINCIIKYNTTMNFNK